eukprot:1161915-Pelagomonas_calceolata.AAC.6
MSDWMRQFHFHPRDLSASLHDPQGQQATPANIVTGPGSTDQEANQKSTCCRTGTILARPEIQLQWPARPLVYGADD